MARLAEYFVVVSYGSVLEPIDPSELHASLGAADAAAASSAAASELAQTTATHAHDPHANTVVAAVAQVGGAGGPKEVEASITRVSQSSATRSPPSCLAPPALSPVAASPNTHSDHDHTSQTPRPSPSPEPSPFHSPSPPSSVALSAEESPSTARQIRSSPTPDDLSTFVSEAAATAAIDPADDLGSNTVAPATSIAPASSPSSGDLPLCVSVSPSGDLPLSPMPSTAINPGLNVSTHTPLPVTPRTPARSHGGTMKSPRARTMTSPLRGASSPTAPRSLLSFTERIYRGKIVDRFPMQDHRSVPFPPGIAMFCIPDDIKLSIVPDLPVFYFFAATGANGVRLYGSCLRFVEPLPSDIAEQVWSEEKMVHETRRRLEQQAANGGGVADLKTPPSSPPRSTLSPSRGFPPAPNSSSNSSSSSSSSTASSPTAIPSSLLYQYCLQPAADRPPIYASKCLCLLSTTPFLRPFRQFLTELYRSSLTPAPMPLERVICNFMCEVPLPPLGEIKVQYALSDQTITFARPPANNPFGFHHFPIRLLFECLDFAHVLLLFECVLCEKRILLLSSHLSLLTVVAETVTALMYPFQWPHVYIPLLPKSLIDFLHAPMPFIIGMHSAWIDVHAMHGDILDDLVLVDLDHNRVDLPGRQTRRPPPMPAKEKKKLWKKLKPLRLCTTAGKTEYEQKLVDTMDLAFSNAPLPAEVETAEQRRGSIHHLVNVEISKNQNSSPTAASKNKHRHQQMFSSGLHTTMHRERAHSQVAVPAITSPSALVSGLRSRSASQSDGSDGVPVSVTSGLFDADASSIDYLICSAFFRVFVSLFKDYRPFLIFPTADEPCPDPCFDLKGFLHAQESGLTGCEAFMREFTNTQCFRKFVEERTFPVHSKEQGKRITFFEESILAKRNRSRFTKKFETPFLKDRSTDLSKTFVAPSPDATNLPLNRTYVYPLFPPLDATLFTPPRISAPLIISQPTHSTSGMVIQQSGIRLGSWQPHRLSTMQRADSSRRSFFNAVQTTSSEQVVATLWFVLFTAIIGARRDARSLDTAFQVLINMRNNGLQPEEEIFPCFMAACGRCGVPERAIDVLREMSNSGFQPDSNTYAALLQVFTMSGDHRGAEAMARLKGSTNPSKPVTGGALVSSLKRELSKPKRKTSALAHDSSPAVSRSISPPPPPTTFYQHPADPHDPSSPCSSPQPLKITEIRESERIRMFQMQFEMIFAGLQVTTEERCPECNKKVEDHHIRLGWTHNPHDYTTACPFCQERFVARFSVVSRAWAAYDKTTVHYSEATPKAGVETPAGGTPRSATEDSQNSEPLSPDSLALYKATKTLAASASFQNPTVSSSSFFRVDNVEARMPSVPAPPILVEYLSPRVLKKEVLHLLEARPPRYFCSRACRRTSPVLFWNLVWHFTNQCLPVDFLLREETTTTRRNKKRNVAAALKRQNSRREEDSPTNGAPPTATATRVDSDSSPPLDEYDRVIAASRASGVGRAFGYGSGGLVSGEGAVGISLGSLMRVQADAAAQSTLGHEEDDDDGGHTESDEEEDDEDESMQDEYDGEDRHSDSDEPTDADSQAPSPHHQRVSPTSTNDVASATRTTSIPST